MNEVYEKYLENDVVTEDNAVDIIDAQQEEIERLKKELEIEQDINDGMLETIDKAIKYIEDKYAVILADELFLEHDERIERKRLLHILEILKKEENNESSNINREINQRP